MQQERLYVEQGGDMNGEMIVAGLRANVRRPSRDGWNVPGICKCPSERCIGGVLIWSVYV